MKKRRDASENSETGSFPDSDTWSRNAVTDGNKTEKPSGPVSDTPSPSENSTGGMVSVEDILSTPNLVDRMEKARIRHAQIQARRRMEISAADAQQWSPDGAAKDETGTFVLADPIKNPAVAAYVAAAAPEQKPPKPTSRAPLLIVTAAVIALIISAAVPGRCVNTFPCR